MNETVGLVISLATFFVLLTVNIYGNQKRKEYKHDERWQAILNASYKIQNRFLTLVLNLLLIVSMLLYLPMVGDFQVSLRLVILLAIALVIIIQLVGMLAQRYFDKRM